ncbi:MAG: sodium/glutamate symporter [Cyanobacteriota bacterium]
MIQTFALALLLLIVLLAIGTVLGRGLGSHRWGIPEALLAGSLGLLVAPSGPWPLIPQAVIDLWDQLPLILLTMVFGSLLLGKPLPRPGGLWRPLSAQVLLALTLAFGQYLVASLAVLFLLQPWLGVSPVMACLIEVAYEGGHGSAAAMGPTYERLGLVGGEALGLAMATVGLLASTLVGGLVVVVARSRGWLTVFPPIAALDPPPPPLASGEAAPSSSAAASATAPSGLAAWSVNLALAGIAVAIGWLALEGLQAWAQGTDGVLRSVIDALPVFPLALVGSLLVRLVLERTGSTAQASAAIQSRIGTLCADLLITAATACLDLSLLAHNWRPLSVLALVGLAWNLAVILLLAPRILPPDWFERGILEFGQATGVAASGLLLLRMADPEDRSEALQAFSIKQLLLQPLIAGGVITVVAPLAVDRWGLPAWTALCLGLVVLWIALGLISAPSRPRSPHPP